MNTLDLRLALRLAAVGIAVSAGAASAQPLPAKDTQPYKSLVYNVSFRCQARASCFPW
jgi:hypothetical protein